MQPHAEIITIAPIFAVLFFFFVDMTDLSPEGNDKNKFKWRRVNKSIKRFLLKTHSAFYIHKT